MRGRRGSAAIVLAGIVSFGCVTRGAYDAEVARAKSYEAELSQCRVEAGDLRQSSERLGLERGSLAQERLDLIRELEDLRASLEQEKTLRVSREQEIQEISSSYGRLVEGLEKEVAAGQIEIHELKGRLQVRALEQILFDSGRADIKPAGREVLKKLAPKLQEIEGHNVRIEGHTDKVPIRTSQFPSNWELSVARAAAVARLLEASGVGAEKLSAVGFGPNRPIGSNDTREGRARNRRIEIVLVPTAED